MNQSLNSPTTRFLFGPDASRRADLGTWVLVAACVALLAWKVRAIWTLNVNWDEFFFLTQVHELVRGELDVPFQTAFAQAFRWLPGIEGGEMAQIHVARLLMAPLLAVSVWQIVRLASRWTSQQAAVGAGIGFLCFLPTQVHGASFRADSLLLPILMGTVLLLTRPARGRRTDVFAGVLCGLGMTISVKLALFAPLFLACLLLSTDATTPLVARLRIVVLRGVVIGAVTLAVAALLVSLHQWSLPATGLESASSSANRSFAKTVLETRFLPTDSYVRNLLRADRFPWAMMALGFCLSLLRRRWHVAAMALALTPVLFYRNAFPYFYVEMLAPAVLLIALFIDELRALASRGAGVTGGAWVPIACGLLLFANGAARVPKLGLDQQSPQHQILNAVHRIFPQPVAYMDHAGMVASFRKVNFFMSRWGMEGYQRRGKPFVLSALREFRPPLLLLNRDFLNVYSKYSLQLMPEDREALGRFYHPYWGPILVAGAREDLTDAVERTVALPFPGKYRLVSEQAVLVDGALRQPGDVLDIAGESVRLAREGGEGEQALTVKLLTAQAGAPPVEPPDFQIIFTPL